MSIPVRRARERVIQTLWYELIGVVVIAPLYCGVMGSAMVESFTLLAVLSLTVMIWSAIFNMAFDFIEYRRVARIASNRPARFRIVHALMLELGATVVSWPVIALLSGFGWLQAFPADVALTCTYATYAYFFHLTFDRLRPITAVPQESYRAAFCETNVNPGVF